ncbi:MAG: hypothetical protein EA381_04740 [Planctomycetaceae bacterium]|nr:MAG: hypothetical protein EA381_04740 [Planctomycetaceae bacterium]
MTGPSDAFTRLPDELSEADERALDALLREATIDPARGTQPARDFTDRVLVTVRNRSGKALTSVASDGVPLAKRRPSIGFWVGIAAATLAMVGYQANRRQVEPIAPPNTVASANEDSSSVAGVDAARDDGDTTILAEAGRPLPSVPDQPTRKPPLRLGGPDPVDLEEAGLAATDTPRGEHPIVNDRSDADRRLSGPASARALTVDSDGLAAFDREFQEYWVSIGITPAPLAEPSAWSDRVADRFGIGVDPAGDPQDLIGLWAHPGNAEALADRMIGQLSRGLRVDESVREQWVHSAAEVIRRGDGFDVWLAAWVQDQVAPLAPIPSADKPMGTPRPDAVGEWFASRIAGADVGCARCHDSPIDSRFTQQDYWAVAALISGPKGQPTFYELADGRQRIAEPAIPARWFGSQDSDSSAPGVGSRESLDRLIVGNRQVARTLANHLWAIGFGTPMVASASSPIAPPLDDAIERSLEMLTERLLASDFDLRAAATWVIGSDPMRRGLPEVFQNDRWQVAPEENLVQASLAQRSFAAARAHWPPAGRRQLLAMMTSRDSESPAKIGPQASLLAQPLVIAPLRTSGGTDRAAAATPNVQREDHWWAQWMADREGLRGGWLESIADRDQQRRHAFYAAGFRQFTPEHQRLADELLGPVDEIDDGHHSEVAKLFWVIQNGK